MQTKFIEADYCSWMVVNFKPHRGKDAAGFEVRGDIQGPLVWEERAQRYTGWFELPAKGEELGYYEIVTQNDHESRILRRVNILYTFDKHYFPPRWENIDQINGYLARRFTPLVERQIIYSYPRYHRNIQLLKVTDPAVPLTKKQVILLTARVHNPESGTTASLFRFTQWLLEGEGREFLREYLFLIIPMLIPLTFEEDPREHAVNREWREEMTESDLLAIRRKVIDRYRPEAWIDCHTFNAEMDLTNKKEMREQYGDYIVAHAPNEQDFDYEYTRDIARRLIHAAELQGHRHRHRTYFLRWEQNFNKGLFVRPGEKIKTDFDPAGIFSGRDYAVYADRDPYGLNGRTWPAMACDYGYARCHAINLCLESKPLHVYWGQGPFHYPRQFSDSTVVKLQELCRLGRNHFSGQARPGFPCNLIVSDVLQDQSSLILCAWGKDREVIRQSRTELWRHRYSIQIRRESLPEKTNEIRAVIFCVRNIEPTPAALRIKIPTGVRSPKITLNGKKCRPVRVSNEYLFIPLQLKQGKQKFQITWS
jgi:hypothetical protein